MIFPPFSAALANGTSILIREVTQDDRHLLETGFADLSTRAKHFRFMGAHKKLSEMELDTFTATNEPDHVAIGALLAGTAEPEPIGIARYIQLPDQQQIAEIAITIADSYQHQGLGSLLLRVLAKFARQNGITEFYALVHKENTGMLRLLDRFGGTKTLLGGSEIDARFSVSALLTAQANLDQSNAPKAVR
jgi:RimJ/RimL family protein N-acetyltransferase